MADRASRGKVRRDKRAVPPQRGTARPPDGSLLSQLEARAQRVREGDARLALDVRSPDVDAVGGLLEALLVHAHEAVALNARESRRFLEVSDSFCALTGYERVELLGRTSEELGLVDPAKRAEVVTRVDAGLEGRYELQLTRKDGEHRWVEFSHQLFDGTRYVLTVVRDLTARHEAEKAASGWEERLRTALSETGAVAFTQDRALRYTWVANPVLGLTDHEILGHTDDELWPPESAATLTAAKRTVLESGSGSRTEVTLTGPAGAGSFELILEPRTDDSGTVIGVVGLGIDVTRLRGAEEAQHSAEERYRSTFENAAIGIAAVAPDGRFIRVNPWLCQITGYSEAELLARTWIHLSHPEDLPASTELVRRLTDGEIPSFTAEKRLVRKSGTVVWVVVTRTALRNPDGTVREFVATISDVSDQVRARQELTASEARFRAAFEHAPLGVAELSPQGRFLRVNRRLCQLLGYSDAELLARGWQDITHPDDRARDHVEITPAATGLTFATQKRYIRKDGQVIWGALNVSRLEKTAGAERGNLIAIIVDVTEQNQARDEILRLNAELEDRVRQRTTELEAANRDMASFSYSVAHDLRAPIRALAGYGELLADEYGPVLGEDGRGYVSRIREAALRMGRLIDDLLDLSRLSRAEMVVTTVDLADLARPAVEALRDGDPDRTVRVDIEAPMLVEGDPRLLRIVLDNLLGNAWKFTAQTPEPVISLATGPAEPGEVHCVLRDNGAGFDPALADRLFTPFARLHSAIEFPGTGIGLAIVARIVERHGGRCWGESGPGAGATMHVTLPAPPGDTPRASARR